MRKVNRTIRTREDWLVLLISLIMSTVLGIGWIFLISPWEHHDEPQHFQYLRLLVDRKQIPTPGDEDWHLNRQILKSMIWNGFFTRLAELPPLPPPKAPVYLPGYSQLDEPPAYFLAAALPIYLLREQNVTRQLYAGRLVSLVFMLITVTAAWGLAGDLTVPGSPIRWMVPISIGLLPGFVDVMTAFNNDAGAVAVTSLFLWLSTRLIIKGFRWLEFVLICGLAVLSWFTKSTSAICLVLFPFALLFTFLRGRYRWIAWTLVGLGVVTALLISIRWEDPALFYRSGSQQQPFRTQTSQSVHGKWAFQVNPESAVTPVWMSDLFQPVPLAMVGPLMGKEVTFGVWMWADHPMTVNTPIIQTPVEEFSQTVSLTEDPKFFAIPALVDEKTARLWIKISPNISTGDPGMVYYDGLILAEGKRPIDDPPIFDDIYGNAGTWGDEPFVNLVRNGSAEKSGLRIASRIDDLGARYIPDNIRPSLVLVSLWDVPGAGWYYALDLDHLFRTFWGYFGWAHIPLAGQPVYILFYIITILGLIGALIALLRNLRKNIDWSVVFYLGLSIFVSWFATMFRGVIYLTYANMFFPSARYASPVIIPVMILLSIGWVEIARLIISGVNRITGRTISSVSQSFSWKKLGWYSIFWIMVDLYAIFSVILFYRQ